MVASGNEKVSLESSEKGPHTRIHQRGVSGTTPTRSRGKKKRSKTFLFKDREDRFEQDDQKKKKRKKKTQKHQLRTRYLPGKKKKKCLE